MQTPKSAPITAGMLAMRTLPPPTQARFSAPEPPPEAATAPPQLEGDALLEQMIRLL